MYLGKDTTLNTLETMCNARAWLKKNGGKSFAKGRNMQHPTMWQSWTKDVGSICTALKLLLI